MTERAPTVLPVDAMGLPRVSLPRVVAADLADQDADKTEQCAAQDGRDDPSGRSFLCLQLMAGAKNIP